MSDSENWEEHDVLADPDATADDYRLEIMTLRDSLEKAHSNSLLLPLLDRLQLVMSSLILSSRTLFTLARATKDADSAEKLKELARQMQAAWEKAAP